MSLVGPRPMMPGQAALYPGRAYYALRPGVTGFWQISDRNETSFAGRAAFDTEYLGRGGDRAPSRPTLPGALALASVTAAVVVGRRSAQIERRLPALARLHPEEREPAGR